MSRTSCVVYLTGSSPVTRLHAPRSFALNPSDLKVDEETRISIMNLVKQGHLSVEEALGGAMGSPSASAVSRRETEYVCVCVCVCVCVRVRACVCVCV